MRSLTRRILAILFGVCGAGVLTYLSIMGSQEALVALISTVSLIIGFYFGTQQT